MSLPLLGRLRLSVLPRLSVPDTLFARIAVVLVLNLFLVQIVAFLLVGLESRRQLEDDPEVADRVAAAVQSLNALPPTDRERFAHALSEPGFLVRVTPPGVTPHGPGFDHPPPDHQFADGGPPPPPPDEDDGPESELHDRLAALLKTDGTVPDIRLFQEPGGPPGPPSAAGGETPRWSHVVVALKDGGWAGFRVHRRPAPFRWYPVLMFVALICIVVSTMSLLFARSFSRHLADFAGAAEAFGRSADTPPLPESGPREIRLATGAFNRMQGRLKRFIRDRTQMLAAISHDLRTPLTRLRLRAEFVEDEEQREKMLQDIAEMEAMIRETLAFARDDFTAEQRQPEDLDQLLDDFAMVMREAGQDVTYGSAGLAVMPLSPTAIRRAFGNLLDNAVKYGARARVALRRGPGQVLVEIDDDGPGIPPAMQEQVFQPFFRLEASRNRDTGGVGLGLAVARTIIRGHGGDVTLANRPGGGLRVTVSLPA